MVGLSPLQIQRRFTAAARAAGIEARVTAHSGRVGLASELTARGASTTEVMLARQLENRPHGRALLGRRDRRTRGRPKVFVKAGTARQHYGINRASLRDEFPLSALQPGDIDQKRALPHHPAYSYRALWYQNFPTPGSIDTNSIFVS